MAGVDLRRGRLIAYSSSRTRDGLWVTNGVFEILGEDAEEEALGDVVGRMLSASEEGVSTPDLRRGPSPFAPVLAAVGLRSYSGYARGTRHVHVEQEDDRVLVMPSRNGGSNEGFVGLAEEAIVVQGRRPEALGVAVRAALARST